MNKTKGLYLFLLIACISAVCFSIYYYQQVETYESQLKKRTLEQEQYVYRFTLIGEEMDNEYWKLIGDGAQETATSHQLFLNYTGPIKSNPEEQLKLLDMAIYEKVDGIIVQAVNENFRPYIEKAIDEGIPVLTIDTDIEDSGRYAYIGSDNYKAGQLAGEALIEDTKDDVKVGIITGKYTSVHHQLRVKGFTDAVKEEKRIEIIALDESNITRLGAEEKAFNMLSQYEEMNALYGTSALDAIGIAAAVQTLEKQHDIYIIGFDLLEPSVELLKTGMINTLIAQNPDEIGKKSIQLMLDLKNGKKLQDIYHTNISVVRKADIGEGK